MNMEYVGRSSDTYELIAGERRWRACQRAQLDRAGLYLYSTNSRGQVWTEQGLTTQSNFDAPPPWARQTDSGWRKQRLVLTRFRPLRRLECPFFCAQRRPVLPAPGVWRSTSGLAAIPGRPVR